MKLEKDLLEGRGGIFTCSPLPEIKDIIIDKKLISSQVRGHRNNFNQTRNIDDLNIKKE